jgi:hypothetical protein
MKFSSAFYFSSANVNIQNRVRMAPGIPGISLKKKLILNNPEMSLISKQYSANPWNVLEFYKS